jgi:hypothetical protein
MPEISDLLLAACMFLGAALYTSVGHAALALNVLVASFTSFRYVRAGMLRGRVLGNNSADHHVAPFEIPVG